ncbi:30433_t:CDS:2 [Gigaspora margarita]|uniref:30433_t:CDS:1 n=1 Tax=Gigaspora margarita TaxID=4874 RepID=A0ABN7V494_GIGMA|nr:30433_t:CDS:2 [Gigaspora margarita]
MVNASSVEDNELIKRLKDNDIDLIEYSMFKDAKFVKIRGYGIVLKGSWRKTSIIMKHLPNELTNQDNNNNTLHELVMNLIVSNMHEDHIHDTPQEYIYLYEKCWNLNSNERPTAQEVYDKLIQFEINLREPQNTNHEKNGNAEENIDVEQIIHVEQNMNAEQNMNKEQNINGKIFYYINT